MPFLPVGGQAVIEGVMMRSPSRVAIAVRRHDGSIAFLERPFVSVTRRFKALGLPVVRGAVSLFETLFLGMSALNFSADQATHDEPKPASAGSATATETAKPSVAQGALQILTVAGSLALGFCCSWFCPPGSPAGWGSPAA